MASIIVDRFKLSEHSVIDLFAKQYDFDPQKSNETPTNCTRLEDVDESIVRRYIDQLSFSVNNYTTNSLKEKRRDNKYMEGFSNPNDDGDSVIIESDLVEVEYDFSAREITKWNKFLPRVIRRMHDKSKELGISVFSLVRAAYIAEKENAVKLKMSNNQRQIAPRQLVKAGVYIMDINGNVGERITKPSYPKLVAAKNWYLTCDDLLIEEINELLMILSRLEIDITRESPVEYDEEFVMELSINFIASNQMYMISNKRAVNKNVLNELKRMPLEDYGKPKASTSRKTNEREILNNLVLNAISCIGSNNLVYTKDSLNFLQYGTMQVYNQLHGTYYDLSKLRTYKGFYVIPTGDFLKLKITDLVSKKIYEKFNGVPLYALVHNSGTFVMIVDTETSPSIFTAGAVNLYNYLRTLSSVKGDVVRAREEYSISKGDYYGKWDEHLL